MDPNATNQYGVPLHACNGYTHDEHYWCWVRAKRLAWMGANPGASVDDYINFLMGGNP